MQIKNQYSTASKHGRNKEQGSLSKREEFMMLPDSERSKILKLQSDKLISYYEKDEEWKEFQALDIKDE